ncbi:MAG: hypothetical protein KAV42_09220 [Candidatus Krumholzibacteria bacterium]|nr:hypothetical protein [Candidatus Krumholzibacteria bacterium]
MSSFIAIGLIVFLFVLSFFAKKFRIWKVMSILYLACTIYFIVAAITGTVRLYFSIAFIILGIYGIVKSIRESRAPDRQTLDQSDS